jgi:hypothetical protein
VDDEFDFDAGDPDLDDPPDELRLMRSSRTLGAEGRCLKGAP